MKCKKVQKLIPEYLEDTLTESKSMLVDEHLHNCDACRRELRAIEKTIRLASNMQVEYPQPELWENFVPILHARIAQQKAEERKKPTGWFASLRFASYGVAALIFIGFLALGMSIMISDNRSEASPLDIETIIAIGLINDTLAMQFEKAYNSVVNESPIAYEVSDVEDDITFEYDISVAEGERRVIKLQQKQLVSAFATETVYSNGFIDDDLQFLIASLEGKCDEQ